MIPGEIIMKDNDLELNAGCATVLVEAAFPDGTKLITVHDPIR